MCKFYCLLCADITAEELFRASDGEESLYTRLQRLLSEVLQTDLDKVQIFSLASSSHSSQQHLSLWFAASGSPYYKPERLHGSVAMHKAKVTTATQMFRVCIHILRHIQYIQSTSNKLLCTCTWSDNLHEEL